MKKIVSFLALWAFLFLPKHSHAQARTSVLDQKYGFRDVRFEMPVSTIKGLVFVSKEGNYIKTYTRPTDKLSVGQAKLTKIVYQFYKGQLHIVALYCDKQNADALLYALNQAYGEAEKSTLGMSSWYANRVWMTYFSFSQENGYAWVCLSSRKLDDKSRADAQKRVRDDF